MKDNKMPDVSWNTSTALQRIEALEARLDQGHEADQHVFTHTYFDEAKRFAEQLPAQPKDPLNGALVSIKDLFDIKGHVTHAGTVIMSNDAAAQKDAEVVAKLRSAGAVVVGHTNMTELAYSGLGLNPHYGTPQNTLDPLRIPGGSTSGGAVSVAAHMVDIAIGTDTGGSLRIPAAFNQIVGFKPTQSTVSRVGCKPLSITLDSVGPMARTVAACALGYDALRNQTPMPDRGLKAEFVIPQNFGFEDMDPAVATQFNAVVGHLENAGFVIQREVFASLEHYKNLPIWQFAAVEARAAYDDQFAAHYDDLDPRVASRMARADEVDAVAYRKTVDQREALIPAFEAELGERVLLLPTTPILPPKFSELEQDEAFGRSNLLALRNPSLANVLDCCSVSLPWGGSKTPIGVMLTATAHRDRALLDLAKSVEKTLTHNEQS